MAVLKYWDGAQYVPVLGGIADTTPDEVAVQPDQPAEPIDLWVDPDDDSGSGDVSWIDQATADGLYVNVTGDTMTGPLVLAGDPVAPMEAVTKQYADANASGVSVHNELTGRSTADSHPISAVTSLQSELDSIAADVATRAKVTISTAAPASPAVGDIWVDTN